VHSLVAQPEDFKVTWGFNGSQHFLSQYAPLAPYHAWLKPLFTALDATDRQTRHCSQACGQYVRAFQGRESSGSGDSHV